MSSPETYWLIPLFFVISVLYSSVGFGGGSSYLAFMSLLITDFNLIRTTALLCNIAVVSVGFWLYSKAGYFDWKKAIPFVLSSIPAAYTGAIIDLTENIFFVLLGCSLLVASFLMILQSQKKFMDKIKLNTKLYQHSLLGGSVGLLSGLVGIGGGIFLSPLLNLIHWDEVKKIAALASFFILINSLSGLSGLITSNHFSIEASLTFFLVVTVIVGGQIGSRLSIHWLKPNVVRILTAILVGYVGLRILLFHLYGIQI